MLCITQEYSQGTIRLTFAATLNRTQVCFTKLVVVVFTCSLISTLFITIAKLLAKPILRSRGYDGVLMQPNAPLAYLAQIVMLAIVGTLGLSIGFATRNPPSAV